MVAFDVGDDGVFGEASGSRRKPRGFVDHILPPDLVARAVDLVQESAGRRRSVVTRLRNIRETIEVVVVLPGCRDAD
jgi:hypothetical protein